MFSTESITLATSDSRTAAAVACSRRSAAGSRSAFRSWSLVPIVDGRSVIGRAALGPVGVRGREHGAHVLQAEAVAVQLRRIDLDAHARAASCRPRSPGRRPAPATASAHDRRGRVVHLARGQDVRGQRQDQDRRVGRIDLAIGRVARQVGGQIAAGGVDGGLHVARGGVDVAVQIELQRDRWWCRA